MRSTIFRSVAAAIVAFTAGCSTTDSVAPTATAAAARRAASVAGGISTQSRTIDQYVWVSCTNGGAGEALHVTGDWHYEVQRTQDSSGFFHLNFKSNTSDLIAVGLTSGTSFRGLMTERITSRAEDYLNEDVRTADIIRFVAPVSGESYSLLASSHFIVDQGSYVLWEQTWSEVCR